MTLAVPVGTTGLAATATDPTVTSDFGANSGVPTLVPVGRFTAHRAGAITTFRWKVALANGIVGFNLYAGKQRLNAHLIPRHAASSYSYRAHLARHSGPYTLAVVLTNGRTVKISGR